ncbi:MAG TPA: ATP-binding protein, partial [Solirubrobacteraceae bacterium]
MLLERDGELRALREALAGAADGRGALVVVEGDPGIGKTTLLDAAREVAREDGLSVLGARGGELERELTFGIARQLLETRVEAIGRSSWPGEADEPSIAHGLYWAVADLAASAPLCVLVDDAHWGDAASLRWLVYLARRLDEVPAAVVVATRTGEPGAPQDLLDALGALADEGGRLLRPSALTAPASEELVRREAGADADESLCRTLHEMAGGNPLLVREAAATVAVEGAEAAPSLRPQALARTVLRRLAGLPDGATALARAVAVLDRDATPANAAALAGLEADAAARAVDELAAARIVQTPG